MQGQSVASSSDDAPVIDTPASLATYLLESVRFTYQTGKTARVTYNFCSDLGASGPVQDQPGIDSASDQRRVHVHIHT